MFCSIVSRREKTPIEEMKPDRLNKSLQKFYLSAGKRDRNFHNIRNRLPRMSIARRDLSLTIIHRSGGGAAKRFGKYPTAFADTEVNNCFSIYHTRPKKSSLYLSIFRIMVGN